jgi:hypothetical protein
VENQNFYQSTGQHYMYRISLQVPQTQAGNSVIIYTPADHYSCSTPSVNESVRQTKQFPNRKAFHGLMCVTFGKGIYSLHFGQRNVQVPASSSRHIKHSSRTAAGFTRHLSHSARLPYSGTKRKTLSRQPESEPPQREGLRHASSR